MKKLSKNEMKKVMGGMWEEVGDGEPKCPTNCVESCSGSNHCRCCHPNTKNAYCASASTQC